MIPLSTSTRPLRPFSIVVLPRSDGALNDSAARGRAQTGESAGRPLLPSPESGLRMLPDHARPQLPADAHGNGHETRKQEHDESGKQQIERVLVTITSGPRHRTLT